MSHEITKRPQDVSCHKLVLFLVSILGKLSKDVCLNITKKKFIISSSLPEEDYKESIFIDFLQFSRVPIDQPTVDESLIFRGFEKRLIDNFAYVLNLMPPSRIGLVENQTPPTNNPSISSFSLGSYFDFLIFSKERINYKALDRWEKTSPQKPFGDALSFFAYLMGGSILENLCFDIISIFRHLRPSNVNRFIAFEETIDLNASFEYYKTKNFLEVSIFSEKNEDGSLTLPNLINRFLRSGSETKEKKEVYNMCHYILNKLKGSRPESFQKATYVTESRNTQSIIVLQLVIPSLKHFEASFFEVLFEYLLFTVLEKHRDHLLRKARVIEGGSNPSLAQVLSEFSVSIRSFKSNHSYNKESLSLLHLERTLETPRDSAEELIDKKEVLEIVKKTLQIFRETVSCFKYLELFSKESFLSPDVVNEILSRLGRASGLRRFGLAFARYVYSNSENWPGEYYLGDAPFRSLHESMNVLKEDLEKCSETLFIQLGKGEEYGPCGEKESSHQPSRLSGAPSAAGMEQVSVSTSDEQRKRRAWMAPAFARVDELLSDFEKDNFGILHEEQEETNSPKERRPKQVPQGASPDQGTSVDETEEAASVAPGRTQLDLVSKMFNEKIAALENKLLLEEELEVSIAFENSRMDALSFSALKFFYNLFYKDSARKAPYSLDHRFSLLEEVHVHRPAFRLSFSTKLGVSKESLSFVLDPVVQILHAKKRPVLERLIDIFNENQLLLEAEKAQLREVAQYNLSALETPGTTFLGESSFRRVFFLSLHSLDFVRCFEEIYSDFEGGVEEFDPASNYGQRHSRMAALESALSRLKAAFVLEHSNNTRLEFAYRFADSSVCISEGDRQALDELFDSQRRELAFMLKQRHDSEEFGEELFAESGYDSKAGGVLERYKVVENAKTNLIKRTLSIEADHCASYGAACAELSKRQSTSLSRADLGVYHFKNFKANPEWYASLKHNQLLGMSEDERLILYSTLSESVTILVELPTRSSMGEPVKIFDKDRSRQQIALEELVFLVASFSYLSILDQNGVRLDFKFSFSFVDINLNSYLVITMVRKENTRGNGTGERMVLNFIRSFKKLLDEGPSSENAIQFTLQVSMAIREFVASFPDNLLDKSDLKVAISLFLINNYGKGYTSLYSTACAIIEGYPGNSCNGELIKFLTNVEKIFEDRSQKA